jgi:hypothetical protein
MLHHLARAHRRFDQPHSCVTWSPTGCSVRFAIGGSFKVPGGMRPFPCLELCAKPSILATLHVTAQYTRNQIRCTNPRKAAGVRTFEPERSQMGPPEGRQTFKSVQTYASVQRLHCRPGGGLCRFRPPHCVPRPDNCRSLGCCCKVPNQQVDSSRALAAGAKELVNPQLQPAVAVRGCARGCGRCTTDYAHAIYGPGTANIDASAANAEDSNRAAALRTGWTAAVGLTPLGGRAHRVHSEWVSLRRQRAWDGITSVSSIFLVDGCSVWINARLSPIEGLRSVAVRKSREVPGLGSSGVGYNCSVACTKCYVIRSLFWAMAPDNSKPSPQPSTVRL